MRSEGSQRQPSRWTTAYYKLRRLWKLGKSSLVSQPALSKGPAHGVELEEDEKPIDKPRSHSNPSRRAGDWFSKCNANPRGNHPNSSSRKQGMADGCTRWRFLDLIVVLVLEAVPASDGVPSTSSRADKRPVSFKQFLMQRTGTATARILQPLMLFSVPCFPSCISGSVESR